MDNESGNMSEQTDVDTACAEALPTVSPDAEWLTPKEVGIVFGISKDKLQRLRTAGEKPYFSEVGCRTILYKRSHVAEWLESKKVEKTEDEDAA